MKMGYGYVIDALIFGMVWWQSGHFWLALLVLAYSIFVAYAGWTAGYADAQAETAKLLESVYGPSRKPADAASVQLPDLPKD